MRDLVLLHFFKSRRRRKVIGWETEDFEKAIPAFNRGGIFIRDNHLDFAGRQLPDNAGQTADRQSDGTRLHDLQSDVIIPRTGNAPADHDIQIRGSEAKLLAVGFNQHVGKDRQRGAAADHVLDLLQTFQKLFFADAELHRGKLKIKALSKGRGSQSASGIFQGARMPDPKGRAAGVATLRQ